ncbi:MAG: DUF4097 family beta strand repeat-containing protein [Acidobacteriota bacterium]
MFRRVLSFATAVLIGFPALAGTARHHREHTFSFKAGGTLEVRAAFHDVRITLDRAATTVKVVVEAELTTSSGDAEKALEPFEPVFEESGGTLRVRCRPSASLPFGFRNSHGLVQVTAPPGMDLAVGTGSGDVLLSGSDPGASLNFDSGSGNIRVEVVCRVFTARTGSGNVHACLEAEAERIRLATGSGDIDLRAGAREVKAQSGAGNIRAEGLMGQAAFETGSGDIEASWSNAPGDLSIRVKSASGNLRLVFPAGTPLRGELRSHAGRIQSDFPGTLDDRRHRFSLLGNPPAAELSAESGSGDLSLRAASPGGV